MRAALGMEALLELFVNLQGLAKATADSPATIEENAISFCRRYRQRPQRQK